MVVGQQVIVLQRIQSCRMAQALEQKVMMLFHRDCQVKLFVVGHSTVEPKMKVGHKILLV
jgi:hypothetical protein